MPEKLHNTVADLDKIVSLTFLHGKTDGRHFLCSAFLDFRKPGGCIFFKAGTYLF